MANGGVQRELGAQTEVFSNGIVHKLHLVVGFSRALHGLDTATYLLASRSDLRRQRINLLSQCIKAVLCTDRRHAFAVCVPR